MIRELVELGDPVLREAAEAVVDSRVLEIQNIAADLMDTVIAASGMGIAAPQIGVSKQICVISSRPNARYPDAPLMTPFVMINPEIVWRSSKEEKDWEGCLSIPGMRGYVPRADAVRIRYREALGFSEVTQEFSGFVARVCQHEIDHLHGIVFLDRVASSDLITEKEYKKLLTPRI